MCLNTVVFEDEYSKADVIFLGVVTEVNKDEYTFRVTELLKGEMNEFLIGKNISSCSIFPSKQEYWLIYAKKEASGLIDVSQCGSSRPLNIPVHENGYTVTLEPKGMSIGESFLSNQNDFNIELSELHFEISTMRHRRLQGIIERSLEEVKNKTEDSDNTLIYLGLILSLLFNIVILFRLKR